VITKEIAFSVIDHALSKGASFCDLFVEKLRRSNIQLLDSKVESIYSGIEFGIGVRLLFGTKVLYGYSNSAQKEDLLNIVELLCERDQTASSGKRGDYDHQQLINNHPHTMNLYHDIPVEEKISYLKRIDSGARSAGEKIKQVNVMSLQKCQEVEIFNSDGLHTEDQRNYIRFISTSIASDGTVQEQGYKAPGNQQGWEFSKTLEPEQLGEQSAAQAIRLLSAKPCPGGKMPVIIGNAFGGVIFHEACGHLLETTSVQKKASVFHDKMGEMIASPVVSAADDGTIKNAWGSLNIDDEGMPTENTQLIKDGKLVSFMVDKVGAMKTGFERTGSGRRQNYKFAPASRMRNTFIQPGKDKVDDMIASIENGIYATDMGGGSVSPGTGEFNFNVKEARIIKNGKLTETVKGATLIGTGPDVLQKIEMVADNFEQSTGICGSVSGMIPANVGQPSIKVSEILVGGVS
jgi:TldD protein